MNSDTIYANLRALFPDWNNTSQLSIQKTIANGVGVPLDNTESELINTTNIITNIIKNLRQGDTQFYIDTALAYEPGVDLIKDENLEWIYQTPDSTKTLIVQAAVEITDSPTAEVITLKVNKKNSGTGLLEKLTIDESTLFAAYMRLFQIPGIPITIVSIDPDLLNFTAEISVLNNYDMTTAQAGVEAIYILFRDTYKYNGVLYIDLLQKYIVDNVPGVKACYIHDFSIPNVTFDDDSAILPSGCFNYDSITTNYISINANI